MYTCACTSAAAPTPCWPEAHERSLHTDVLFALMKRAVASRAGRPPPRRVSRYYASLARDALNSLRHSCVPGMGRVFFPMGVADARHRCLTPHSMLGISHPFPYPRAGFRTAFGMWRHTTSRRTATQIDSSSSYTTYTQLVFEVTQRHAIPCHAMLCYAVPCYAIMLCYTILRADSRDSKISGPVFQWALVSEPCRDGSFVPIPTDRLPCYDILPEPRAAEPTRRPAPARLPARDQVCEASSACSSPRRRWTRTASPSTSTSVRPSVGHRGTPDQGPPKPGRRPRQGEASQKALGGGGQKHGRSKPDPGKREASHGHGKQFSFGLPRKALVLDCRTPVAREGRAAECERKHER